MKNIIVIFGAKSTEHDISIITASQVLSALDRLKYNVIPVYIDTNGIWWTGKNLFDIKFFKQNSKKGLKEVAILPNSQFLFKKQFGIFRRYKKIDCAIVSCHGKNGEDGTVQGLLELSNIPYSSAGVLASAVGLDKVKMKQLFAYFGFPQSKFFAINKNQYDVAGIDLVLENLDFPLIVKPSKLGSSIGISICKTAEELKDALDLAFMFDDEVVVEKLIENLKEVNIAVLGNGNECECSMTEQPNSNGKMLTFEKKYIDSSNKKLGKKVNAKAKNNCGTKNGMQNLDRIMPAQISKKEQRQIEALARQIFVNLKLKGVVRMDFMIDTNQKQIYINEINTIPGSFAYYLWSDKYSFSQLLDKIVDYALDSYRDKQNLLLTFTSNVLSGNFKTKK